MFASVSILNAIFAEHDAATKVIDRLRSEMFGDVTLDPTDHGIRQRGECVHEAIERLVDCLRVQRPEEHPLLCTAVNMQTEHFRTLLNTALRDSVGARARGTVALGARTGVCDCADHGSQGLARLLRIAAPLANFSLCASCLLMGRRQLSATSYCFKAWRDVARRRLPVERPWCPWCV